MRDMQPVHPEAAVHEIMANALIRQDFTISGAGPMVELHSNRMEVTNPGNSLIEVGRIVDERRSRNENLASTMLLPGLCEERGGGIGKAIIADAIRAGRIVPAENGQSKRSAKYVPCWARERGLGGIHA